MIHSCGHTCFCFGQTSVRNSSSGYNGESRPEFWILSKIVYLVTRIQCTLFRAMHWKNEARMNWWSYGQRPFFDGLFLIISITSADWHVYKKTDDCNWLLIIRGSIWGIWFLSASFWASQDIFWRRRVRQDCTVHRRDCVRRNGSNAFEELLSYRNHGIHREHFWPSDIRRMRDCSRGWSLHWKSWEKSAAMLVWCSFLSEACRDDFSRYPP